MTACLLCAFLLSGCSVESHADSIVLSPGELDSPVAALLSQVLPEYEITSVPNSGAGLFIDSDAVVELLHTQAEPLLSLGEAYWQPLCYTSVVIAVDRSQTNVVINGWDDLPDANEKVAFYGNAGEQSHKDEMLAVSYGLSGDYSLDDALTLMRLLYERDRLAVLYPSNTTDPFEYAPICIVFDHEAAALLARRAHIEFITPASGTLTYELGLLSKTPLPTDGQILMELAAQNGLQPVFGNKTIAADTDAYNNARMDCTGRLRREVYHTHLYATADGNEHMLSWIALLIIVMLWGSSIVFRVVHPALRRALIGIVACLAFWTLVRIFKAVLPVTGDPFSVVETITRLCWYCYYVPLLACPLLLLWAAWTVGRPVEQTRLPKWFYLLLAIAAIFFVLVVTNDLHQLVFTFNTGFANWDKSHAYGIAGYLMFAYQGAIYTAFVVMLYKRQKGMPGRKRMAPTVLFSLLLPLFLVVGGLYRLDLIPFYPGDLTFTTCILSCCFAESCIFTGAFPSNLTYAGFFAKAGLWMQIKSSGGETVYQTQFAADTPEFSIKSERCAPIPGGTAIWRKDMSAIKSLRSALSVKRLELEERNALLQKEQDVRDELNTVTVQNRLMNEIVAKATADAAVIRGILSEVESARPGAKGVREKLLLCSVLASHIKQKGELLMREKEADHIAYSELNARMGATLPQLQMAGAVCTLSIPEQGELNVTAGSILYDCFAHVAEISVKTAPCDLTILIDPSDGVVRLIAFYDCVGMLPDTSSFEPDAALTERIAAFGGSTRSFVEDETLHWIVTLSGGYGHA